MKDANGMDEKDYADDDCVWCPYCVVGFIVVVACLIVAVVLSFFLGAMRP